MSGALAELLTREVVQKGFGGGTAAPTLSADSKFSAFDVQPLLPDRSPSTLLAGLFLDGAKSPFSRIDGVGYWTDSPRKLWLMLFDRTTAGALRTGISSEAFGLAGCRIVDTAASRTHRPLDRQAHWTPSSASAALGAFPCAIATTISTVEIYAQPNDYGLFGHGEQRDIVGQLLRAQRTALDSSGRAVHVDDLWDPGAALQLLRRDGSVEIGVCGLSQLSKTAASNVVADAGAHGRARVDKPSGQAFAPTRGQFRISVASSRYAETEAAAVKRVRDAAGSVARLLNAHIREKCDQSLPGSLGMFAAVVEGDPKTLPGDLDSWFSRVDVLYSRTERP